MKMWSKNNQTAKARENADEQVVIGFLVLHLIISKASGVSFLKQSQSKLSKIDAIP